MWRYILLCSSHHVRRRAGGHGCDRLSVGRSGNPAQENEKECDDPEAERDQATRCRRIR